MDSIEKTSTWRDILPAERAETQFSDYKAGFTPSQAVSEAQRCLNCYDAPCIRACPTGIDIPQFIGRIATHHTLGAAKTILASNVFGLSCARSCPVETLCEGACVYNHLDHRPIGIGRLQRFAMEKAYHEQNGVRAFFTAGPSTGKKVALVGGGPASLSCAHELRVRGHATTLFEKTKYLGGLNTSGIAPYKMQAQTSLQEIEHILSLGIEIQTEMELGRNLELSSLLCDFDAIFLGLGLGSDRRLGIPGEEHPRVLGAVETVSKLKLSGRDDSSELLKAQSVLVVGGGNTALDLCREMRGLGIPEVICCYRGGPEKMTGYAHELRAAREEGVRFIFHTKPIEFQSAGKRMAVHLQTQSEIQSLDTDFVILAVGQARLEELLQTIPELRFESGRLVVDSNTGRTGHPRIYAGGDLVSGGQEVVNAVAEGKRAAIAIDRALGGENG